MKTPPKKKGRLHPLRHVGITLSPTEVDILAELAREQSDLTGRTVSGSSVVRALIRVAKREIEALRLRDEIEKEIGAGRRWGLDQLGKLQGRGRPRGRPRGRVRTTLTPREHQVLQLLGAGRSNRDIAATLGIAEGTVKLHLQSLREKLEAESRLEAVAIAQKRGLLGGD